MILWRVEGGAPTPVSAARANDRRPSIDELMRLISNPPRLEELGLEPEFPCETDLTATAKLGACHTTDPATGLWSWAIAAVTTRSHPAVRASGAQLRTHRWITLIVIYS